MKIGMVVRRLRQIVHPRIFGKPLFPYYNNETLEWMNYSFASPENGFPLRKQYSCRYALERLPSEAPIIEIGVFSGRSTNFLIYLQESLNLSNRLITTDPWRFGSDKRLNINVTMEDYQNQIKEQFIRNMSFWHQDSLPESFDMNSDNFFSKWTTDSELGTLFSKTSKLGGEISFCYLDGDHSYEQVKKDFTNIDKILQAQGFIFFDDSDRYHLDAGKMANGCYKLVCEILKTKRYVVAIKNPNYLLQKVG
jgi:hypothetical protein